MKRIHIKNAVKTAILVVIFSFTSCSDWLTVAPETELIKDKFWKRTEDVNSALGAAYNALRSASLESLIWGELRADLVVIAGPNFSDYAQIAGSDISPSNKAITWKKYYEAINLANTLMYFDDEVAALDETFTPEMQAAIESEALYIRSMAYFYLVRVWKDVPLVIQASISDTSELYVAKSTEYEILDQVIQDLLLARKTAYKLQFQGTGYFYGRANYYSMTALLADVYLWNEQYQKSIDACDEIINSGLFSLEPAETWFNLYYPGNSMFEGICEIQYDDNLESQENSIYNDLLPLDGRGPQGNVDQQNVNLIMDKEDLRRYNGRGAVWKYVGKDQLGLLLRSFSERDANWIFHRYAEILLIKAEACIEVDRFKEANDLISETMLRAGAPFVEQTDKDLLRELLLDERGREFLFEGRRWFDMLRAAKRNNFENKQLIIDMILSGADIKQQAILRTRVYDTLSYYLPVPERELIFNQNLVQNPFYDR
jgi:hypothetical protein